MPVRNGAIRPKAEVTPPASPGTEEPLDQDFGASQLHQLRAWLPRIVDDWVYLQARRTGSGDLFAGGAAVVALLLMLALGLPPWLAILLAVATYAGITLLQPVTGQRDGTNDDPLPALPPVESAAKIEQVEERQEVASSCTGVEAVAARYGLTRRETEILPLLTQRLTDREIAERLNISHRTAMNHTANILGKLGLVSRRDVAGCIARHESLPPSTLSRDPE